MKYISKPFNKHWPSDFDRTLPRSLQLQPHLSKQHHVLQKLTNYSYMSRSGIAPAAAGTPQILSRAHSTPQKRTQSSAQMNFSYLESEGGRD